MRNKLILQLWARQVIWATHHRTVSEFRYVPPGTSSLQVQAVTSVTDLGARLRAWLEVRWHLPRHLHPRVIPLDSKPARVLLVEMVYERIDLSTWLAPGGKVRMGFGDRTGVCAIALPERVETHE